MSIPGYKPPDNNPNYNENNITCNSLYPTAQVVTDNQVIQAQAYQSQSYSSNVNNYSVQQLPSVYSTSSQQHQQSDQGYRGQPPNNFGSYYPAIVANQYNPQQQNNYQQRGSCILSPVLINGNSQYPLLASPTVNEFIRSNKSNLDYVNFVHLLNNYTSNNNPEYKKKIYTFYIVFICCFIFAYYVLNVNNNWNGNFAWIFWVFFSFSVFIRAMIYRRSFYQSRY